MCTFGVTVVFVFPQHKSLSEENPFQAHIDHSSRLCWLQCFTQRLSNVSIFTGFWPHKRRREKGGGEEESWPWLQEHPRPAEPCIRWRFWEPQTRHI